MDGFEAATLRHEAPGKIDLPIIATLAYREKHRERPLPSALNEYSGKPYQEPDCRCANWAGDKATMADRITLPVAAVADTSQGSASVLQQALSGGGYQVKI